MNRKEIKYKETGFVDNWWVNQYVEKAVGQILTEMDETTDEKLIELKVNSADFALAIITSVGASVGIPPTAVYPTGIAFLQNGEITIGMMSKETGRMCALRLVMETAAEKQQYDDEDEEDIVDAI